MQENLARVGWSALLVTVALVGCGEPYREIDLSFNRAVANGDLEEAERLLQQGADINMQFTRDGGLTNLTMVATTKGYSHGLRFLLERGADPNVPTNKGETALMIAISYETVDYVSILLEHGADPTIAAPDGSTAITYAEEKGNAEITRLLKAAIAGDNAS